MSDVELPADPDQLTIDDYAEMPDDHDDNDDDESDDVVVEIPDA